MARIMLYQTSSGFVMSGSTKAFLPDGVIELGEVEVTQKKKELVIHKWRWVARNSNDLLFITKGFYSTYESSAYEHFLQPILSTEIEEKATIYV